MIRSSVELARTSIRFHDLRHTCATLLLIQGTQSKFVQDLLGHATIAMTLDTYSHFLPSMGGQTVRAMEAALALKRIALLHGCTAPELALFIHLRGI
jgi:integrase